MTSVQNNPLPSPVSLPTVGATGNAAVAPTPALGLQHSSHECQPPDHLLLLTFKLLFVKFEYYIYFQAKGKGKCSVRYNCANQSTVFDR